MKEGDIYHGTVVRPIGLELLKIDDQEHILHGELVCIIPEKTKVIYKDCPTKLDKVPLYQSFVYKSLWFECQEYKGTKVGMFYPADGQEFINA